MSLMVAANRGGSRIFYELESTPPSIDYVQKKYNENIPKKKV